MRRIRTQAEELIRVAVITAALAVSACSTLAPEPVPVEDPPEILVEPIEPVVVEPAPEPTPIPVAPDLPPVSILLTNLQPAYASVAEELEKLFEQYVIYDLSDLSGPPVSVLRQINDSDSGAVIAIGLRAARSAIAMSNTPVVFSQVFNHQDHDLLGENSRGIAALAPLDAQIAAWKKIDPTVARIGVIVGEGHDGLLAEAEAAAARHDVELLVKIARSDQETLYLFKRMVRDVDGYWMFPDNRVLSARILQEMLDEANRQSVHVVVPNESLLDMGAAISMSTVASDIAATIVQVVRRIHAGKIDLVPPLSSLSEVRIATNDNLLRKPAVAKSLREESVEDPDQ
jgi:ABC-type uncharacterized transport system substrate-binding protein